MDVAELERLLDEAFDHAVVHHGYTDYMRDYEVIVYMTADPRTGIEPVYRRYLFRFCVEARCESSVPPETWRASLDDRLIDYETGADLDGYVWGVKCHCMYPGASILPESEAARRWSRATGLDFHEVCIETNAHRLTLLFSDLRVSEVPTGYAPFTTD
ncbi:HalD/BesD family halogenase [Actinacidiphila glaucinigra]|uniref:YxiG-like protein n=1 Tax=Actinacidiphila glaucinigra TaxID=235986 RepID=UPI003D8C4B51